MATGAWGHSGNQKVFKVNVNWITQGQKQQTGFHLRDVAVNDNTPETVVNTVAPWVETNFKTLLQNLDNITSIDAVQLASEEGWRKDYTTLTGTLSLVAVSVVPTFMCAQVAFKTQRRKRYGQGRAYWPIRDENDFTGDILTAGAVTRFQAVIDALTTLFTGSSITHDLKLCNVHADIPARGTRPLIPAAWYDVDSVKLNTAVTFLRSRKAGIGQ